MDPPPLLAAHLGRHLEYRQRYITLLRRFEDLGDRASVAMIQYGAGCLVALAEDAPECAMAQLDRGSEVLGKHVTLSFEFLEMLGRVQHDQYIGDPATGFRRVEASWSRLRPPRLFSMPSGVSWYLWAATGAACGRISARKVVGVARRLSRDPSPWCVVHAGDLRARVLGMTHERDAEIDELRRTRDLANEHDMVDASELVH